MSNAFQKDSFQIGVIHEASASLSGLGTLSISGKLIKVSSASLSGAGTLSVTGKTPGWSNISHVKGIASASISHKKGIAVANISHVKGVAV